MRNTSIKIPIIPTEFNEVVERWRSEGFAVPYDVWVGCMSEEEAVKIVLDDIAEEYPDYEPLETVSAHQDIRFFVAAKCKVKENSHEKSHD